MHPTQSRLFFGRNASVLLDVIRFAAALAVALSHMPNHYVAAAPVISEHSGNQAVCVFFVLSGFVIRYITVARVSTGRDYFVDRASRLYSVVLPLVLLTFLLEPAAAAISPALYHHLQPTPYTWAEMPGELFHNLTFTVGWWDWGKFPLSNSPFWSLSYECVYYALYGFWRYAPRYRWILIPLLLVASGPGIASLFPVWLVGVALHDVYVRWHRGQRHILLALLMPAAYCALLWPVRRPLLETLVKTSHQQRVDGLTRWLNGFPLGRQLFGGGPVHWLDHLSLSFFLVGPLIALLLLPALLILDRYVPPVPDAPARVVRLIADSTFTLYLLHWPLFLFVVCVHGAPLPNWRAGSLLLLATVALSIGLARVFDHLKLSMRAGLRHALNSRPSTPGRAQQPTA